MLILPLHHPLTRRTFPLMTAALLLANAFVFFVLQSGDSRAYAEAAQHHAESGLAEIEIGLYSEHLRSDEGATNREQIEALPPQLRETWLSQATQNDTAFRARLARGELFEDEAQRQTWTPLAETFEQLRQRAVTQRYALSSSEPEARGLFGSMFLHGGFGHLLGNMLFLCFLGLLVEGALGAWRFLGLYLLSGVAAGAAWLAWQGSAPALLVGASGAIAGLMGALGVLWGLRRIRFFYWFFVVFDYVRAPALLLLPAWLGWELLQLFLLPNTQVAYSAHAGGIVAGALLAWGARSLGWTREAFMEDEPDAQNSSDVLAVALAHLGQMRLNEADALLAPLAAAEPQRLDVGIARYRVERYAQRKDRSALIARAHAVLDARSSGGDDSRAQWGILQDLQKLGEQPDAGHRAAFAARLIAIGESQAALELLESIEVRELPGLDLAQQWLSLGIELSDRGNATLGSRALRGLIQRFPGSVQSGKARFLLSEGG